MREEPGSELPAPYVSPWSLLRQDLGAVSASLLLSCREGLRRNREGTLPRPSFWPGSLAALFWPAVLLLLLSVLALLPLGLASLHRLSPPGAARAVPARPPETAAGTAASSAARPSPVPEPAMTGSVLPNHQGSSAGPVPSSIEIPASEQRLPTPEPAGAITRNQPAGSPRELTLLAQLISPETEGLLLGVQEAPDGLRLCLVLAPAFAAMPPARQQRQAEAWQEQVRQLGYEQLELVDPEGGLLGRSARIGSGMILFTMASGA